MTVYDFLRTSRSIIEMMDAHGINANYVGQIDMYAEWVRLKAEGHKSVYAVAYLADKYGCSEQNVWKWIKRLSAKV